MRPLAEVGQLSESKLVQDLARLRMAEVVNLLRLASGEHPQCSSRQLRHKGQRLITRDQAIAPEKSHEPGQARGGQGRTGQDFGVKALRRQVNQTAVVNVPPVVPVGLQRRSFGLPGIEALGHVRTWAARVVRVVLHANPLLSQRLHLDARLPLAVRRHIDLEDQPRRILLDRATGPDGRLANKVSRR